MKGAAIATYLVSKEATYKKQHTLIQKNPQKYCFIHSQCLFFVAIELISQKVVNPGEITNGNIYGEWCNSSGKIISKYSTLKLVQRKTIIPGSA